MALEISVNKKRDFIKRTKFYRQTIDSPKISIETKVLSISFGTVFPAKPFIGTPIKIKIDVPDSLSMPTPHQ